MTVMAGTAAFEIADGAIARGACQKRGELAGLVELVLERKPRTVVEIGTLAGGTLWAWCQAAADDAVVVSIDLPGGQWGGGYQPHDEPRLLNYARPGQTMALIAGDSHDYATAMRLAATLAHHGRDTIDLLFIDGDHNYEGVKADHDDYAPLVSDGGLIAFHDVLPHPDVPDCDVDRLWAELADVYETRFEFLVPEERHPDWGQWGGIGAVSV